MKIEILKQKENPLLNRLEVQIVIKEAGATPKRSELLPAIVAKLGVDEKRIVIDKLSQCYGRGEVIGYIKVYKQEADKNKYEPKPKVREATEKKEERKEEGEKSGKEKEGKKQ